MFLGLILLLITAFIAWVGYQLSTASKKMTGPKKWTAYLLLLCLISCALITGIMGCYGIWFLGRSQPDSLNDSPVFQGVHYTQSTQTEPRPLVIHVMDIDLNAPGISILLTPPDEQTEYDLYAQRTSEFLQKHGLQIALNGAFFTPYTNVSPWNYYPESGDGVDVRGLAISNGDVYGQQSTVHTTLFLDEDNQASFSPPETGVAFNAISGYPRLLLDGEIAPSIDEGGVGLAPRTALALDETGSHLILIAIDGRQPGYSEGVTRLELAQFLREHGGYNGMNLDGGGSTTLVMEGMNGEPEILNCPVHTQIACRERPVGNHLGVFADRIQVFPSL